MHIAIENVARRQQQGMLTSARELPIKREGADEKDEVVDALKNHGSTPFIRSQKYC
jgi:hypothetical protein